MSLDFPGQGQDTIKNLHKLGTLFGISFACFCQFPNFLPGNSVDGQPTSYSIMGVVLKRHWLPLNAENSLSLILRDLHL
jgi:hypothetical protein